MGVELAFIEMVTKLFIKNILAEMTDGDIASSVFDLGKEIVTSIKGKKTPVELYNATFEKIVIKCIGESFETDGHDEEVAKALLKTRLETTAESVTEEELIRLVYTELGKQGVYTLNINEETIRYFLAKISTALRGAVRNSGELTALVTGDNVESIKASVDGIGDKAESIKTTVEGTDKNVTQLKNQNEKLLEYAREDHETLERLENGFWNMLPIMKWQLQMRTILMRTYHQTRCVKMMNVSSV